MGEPIGPVVRDPLDGLRRSGDGVELSLDAPRSIVSIALRADATDARGALERGLGIALPGVGAVSGGDFAGGASVLGLQADQWFVLMPDTAAPVKVLRELVGDAPALTDQSDAWVALVIDGSRATFALERVCRLDLHIDAFPPGRVARTAMEHLAVIVVRETAHRFVLLSPRSSAASFAHAVETSVRYVS